MKTIVRLTSLLLVFVFSAAAVFFVPASAAGQGIAQQPPLSGATDSLGVWQTEDVFQLKDLGFEDATLIGPFASTSMDFTIPPDWVFSQPGTLRLVYYTSISYPSAPTQADASLMPYSYIIGGQLEIKLNNTLITSLTLMNNGEQQINISIPPEALISPRADGRSSLTFSLISNKSCYEDIDVILHISANSTLVLPHEIGDPTIDLARLPYPIYQRTPLQPSLAVMVIPDQPSVEEMRAMIEVAAGFGDMSSGNMLLSTFYASELTPEILAGSHLIFVGKPQAFSLLSQVELPISAGTNGFTHTEEFYPDDGIIQMAQSPWNHSLTVLVVSGNSDMGVVKAGHAINVGKLLTIDRLDLAIVQDIEPGLRMMVSEYDLLFRDLGMTDRTIRGAIRSNTSSNTTDIVFYLPNNKQIGLDSFIEIHYNHSAQLKINNSGMNILLNGRAIGSIAYSNDDINYSTAKIIIPRSAVLPGKNIISIQVSMYPTGICDNLFNQDEVYWTTLYSASVLHISLEDLFVPPTRIVDLKLFPSLLMLNPTPGSLAFVIDNQEPAANKAAASIAFRLGDFNSLITNDVTVQTPDRIDTAALAGKDVILVGTPKNLSRYTEWRDALPVTFEYGTNKLNSINAEVSFRIPEQADIGYLELFPAPWDNSRVTLAVMGTSSQALQGAGRAFSEPLIQPSLAGNFAIISGLQVISVDTRLNIGLSKLPASTPISADVSNAEIALQTGGLGSPPASSVQYAGNLPGNSWILPALAVTNLLFALVVFLLVFSWLRSRRPAKHKAVNGDEEK